MSQRRTCDRIDTKNRNKKGRASSVDIFHEKHIVTSPQREGETRGTLVRECPATRTNDCLHHTRQLLSDCTGLTFTIPSLSPCRPLCLSVCLPAYLPVSQSVSQSVNQSVSQSVCLYICLSLSRSRQTCLVIEGSSSIALKKGVRYVCCSSCLGKCG